MTEEDYISEAVSEASKLGVDPKISKIILTLMFSDGLPRTVIGPILFRIMIQEVYPRMEEEETTSVEEMDYYHYGFSSLLAQITVCRAAKLLQHRHVKKIIDDCWYKYVGYDLVQYLMESKILDEVEESALLDLVKEAMSANQRAVADLRAGKEKSIGALVGYVMKKQKADPVEIQRLIRQEMQS